MASELYNIIEGVSREKGIDPQIVVSAVEDAIVVATRKYYKSQENLRAVLDMSVARRKMRPKDGQAPKVEIELANVEKANLVPEI